MPVEGQRSIAICRQCQSALAVHILSDGSIRPIGTGTKCSCGGNTFDIVGDVEDDAATDDGEVDDAIGDDDPPRKYPKP